MRRVLPFALLASACTTVHGVKPVGRGAVAVEGEVGGPITEVYGLPIPLPLSSVGATYGVSDRVDVHAAVHPSPALLFGLFLADAGVSGQLFPPEGARPRLMADLTLTAGGGDNEPGEPEGGFRLWAQPTLTASWDWGRADRRTAYTSVTAFAQPFPEVHVIPQWAVGNRWEAGRFLATTEMGWIAPWVSTADLAPNYLSPGSLGAIAVRLGAGWRFGGPKEAP